MKKIIPIIALLGFVFISVAHASFGDWGFGIKMRSIADADDFKIKSYSEEEGVKFNCNHSTMDSRCHHACRPRG